MNWSTQGFQGSGQSGLHLRLVLLFQQRHLIDGFGGLAPTGWVVRLIFCGLQCLNGKSYGKITMFMENNLGNKKSPEEKNTFTVFFVDYQRLAMYLPPLYGGFLKWGSPCDSTFRNLLQRSVAVLLYVWSYIYIYENPYGDMIGKYAGNLMECGYDGNMLQILYFL